jgi:hypothetical protein
VCRASRVAQCSRGFDSLIIFKFSSCFLVPQTEPLMGGIERLEGTDWRVEYVAACKSTSDTAAAAAAAAGGGDETVSDSSFGVLSFKLCSNDETSDAPEQTRTFECEMDDVGVRALTDAIEAAAARVEALKRAKE